MPGGGEEEKASGVMADHPHSTLDCRAFTYIFWNEITASAYLLCQDRDLILKVKVKLYASSREYIGDRTLHSGDLILSAVAATPLQNALRLKNIPDVGF
jgi:hypothetical protein